MPQTAPQEKKNRRTREIGCGVFGEVAYACGGVKPRHFTLPRV